MMIKKWVLVVSIAAVAGLAFGQAGAEGQIKFGKIAAEAVEAFYDK